MSGKSAIEWTDATWNPVTGCTHVSEGCRNCYAETLSLRRGWSKKPWTKPNEAENVVLHPERLDWPLHRRKPLRIFVNSMSDLFHERVPFEFIDRVFAVMAFGNKHIYQVLTKRPARMLEWAQRFQGDPGQLLFDATLASDSTEESACWVANYVNGFSLGYNGHGGCWPMDHVWLGVSCEDQVTADERIPLLLQTPAAVRWVSAEPLLGPISFRWAKWHDYWPTGWRERGEVQNHLDGLRRLDWIVCGGESGPHHRPMDLDWARAIRDQCAAAGVPFLFKQVGGRTPKAGGRELDGRTWDEYPTAVPV